VHPSTNVKYVIFLSCTAALGGLLFGFDIAIITGAGPFIQRAFSLGDLALGWAFSSLLFGCVVGSGFAGRLADRFGRKRLLLIVACLFAVTSIATGLAWSFPSFVVARLLGGLAVGGVSLLSPMYIAEIAPSSIRGRLGALYQLAIVTGIIVSYGINYLLRNSGPDNWRWMFVSGVLPSVTFLLLLLVAPETPRFLVLHGKVEQALAVLERINGSLEAKRELSEITLVMRKEPETWRSLLRPGVKRALLVSSALAVLIHVSGVNTVIDYAPTIFQSAGWKVEGALASTLLVGATEFVFTLVSFLAIDRFGRKPLYVIGSSGMAVALILLVIAVLTGHFHGLLVLVLILAYLAFFSSCIGPVFWTLIPEIFPDDVRGMAMTLPVLLQWTANAFVVLFFPYAFHIIGKASTFGFLAAMSGLQAIFTWRFVPETANRNLENIESEWLNLL
jgi:MFS transporter, SP family, arabinose:H+ symporter